MLKQGSMTVFPFIKTKTFNQTRFLRKISKTISFNKQIDSK
jgi:hypothetical protein